MQNCHYNKRQKSRKVNPNLLSGAKVQMLYGLTDKMVSELPIAETRRTKRQTLRFYHIDAIKAWLEQYRQNHTIEDLQRMQKRAARLFNKVQELTLSQKMRRAKVRTPRKKRRWF